MLIEYLMVLETMASEFIKSSIHTHFPKGTAVQDFGDNRELYKFHLDYIVRHILENPSEEGPDAIAQIQESHDISAILAQIESEQAAAPSTYGTEEIAAASKASGEYASAGKQGATSSGEDSSESSMAPLRRSLGLQPKENASISSNLSNTEVASESSHQTQGRRQKRRRLC